MQVIICDQKIIPYLFRKINDRVGSFSALQMVAKIILVTELK